MRWFKKAEPKEEKISNLTTQEIGSAGSSLYGAGAIQRYNPDDLLGRKSYDVYKKMMRDDQVKSVMRFKQYAVISRGWYFNVEASTDEKKQVQSRDMADFFGFVIRNIKGSFLTQMIGVLSALENGFSVTEKVYAPVKFNQKVMWGIKDLKLRPADTFNGGFITDSHGNVLEVKQWQGAESTTLPIDKIIHFVHQPDIDAQYGESDLRACYRNYWSKDIAIKFHNVWLERLAGGFIYAKQKGQLDNTQKTNLQNVLKNITSRMGAIIPDSLVELASFDPLNTDAYEKAIAMHDKGISKSILVPNLLGLSEQGSTGSYSQSKIQMEVFFWILDAIATQLAEILNEQVFRQLALWNYGTEDFPWFTFEPISDVKKAEIAKIWNELVKGGAVTKSDTDETYIRNLVGFPEKKEEIEEEPAEIISPEEPDNEEWIEAQPKEKGDFVRKQFAQKPWLRRVDFAKIEQALDDQDSKFEKEMADILAQAKVSLDSQVIKIGGERSFGNVKPKEVEDVAIPSAILSRLRKTIRANLQETLNENYEQAKKELPVKPHKIIGPGMDKTQAERFLASKAMKITSVTNNDVLKAVQQVLENSIKYDKTLKETLQAMSSDTALVSMLPEVDAAGRAINIPVRLENIARTNTSDAMNQARQSLFGGPDMKGFVLSYEYSAILDDRVTEVCEALNGLIRKDWAGRTPPNHFMCRSLLVPVTIIDEWDGKENSIPAKGTPQKGFM